jgi:1-acyl-sn-glycerol-3-phosphate acyltransferase
MVDVADNPVLLPDIGPRVPRKRNAVTKALSRAALRAAGWHFEGSLPNVPKFVLTIAPHTSNWDFVVGVLARRAVGLDAHFLGKHTLFKPPFGWFMRWLGGMPVRRDVPAGVVEQVTQKFEEHDALVLALAPEGTRKRVAKWRTGFYYIAHGAGVPIVPIALDYGRKRVVAGPALDPSGDLETDLRTLRQFYVDVTPRKMEGVG